MGLVTSRLRRGGRCGIELLEGAAHRATGKRFCSIQEVCGVSAVAAVGVEELKGREHGDREPLEVHGGSGAVLCHSFACTPGPSNI